MMTDRQCRKCYVIVIVRLLFEMNEWKKTVGYKFQMIIILSNCPNHFLLFLPNSAHRSQMDGMIFFSSFQFEFFLFRTWWLNGSNSTQHHHLSGDGDDNKNVFSLTIIITSLKCEYIIWIQHMCVYFELSKLFFLSLFARYHDYYKDDDDMKMFAIWILGWFFFFIFFLSHTKEREMAKILSDWHLWWWHIDDDDEIVGPYDFFKSWKIFRPFVKWPVKL